MVLFSIAFMAVQWLYTPLTGQFPRAMEYYLELDLDPLQVIGLYPNLLPKNLRDKFSYPIEPPQLGACFEACYSL